MTDELCDKTASDMIIGYAEGHFSPVEVIESCVRRIAATEERINAIRHLRAEDAMHEASVSAARWSEGTARPLEGVPFGLKDIVATAGVPTTGGSSLYLDLVPSESASHAVRLAQSGAILLAKLETFEFACGGPTNRTFGSVRNPWDPSRTTGGSSSGSGAAVAAGMMPLAIGTDTGGSIRIPAAYCGLTGLKPTYGRVPRHGVMGLSWTLDHAGPMTRTARDAALMMTSISGHDPRDVHSSSRPVPDYLAGLDQPPNGGRIGRLRGWFEDGVDPDVLERYEAGLEAFQHLGYTVEDVTIPDVDIAAVAAWQVCYPETLALHAANFSALDDRDEMGAGLLAATPFVSAADYLRSLRYRTVFQHSLGDALNDKVALALPGTASTAPRLAGLTGSALGEWLASAVRQHIPFNYAGVPALCIPSGLVEGMPASLQLVGMPHCDRILLAMGHQFQVATDHHLARPAMALAGGVS